MSIQELNNLISSSLTFKTITPMIPVMFYFLGTQTNYQDIKDTIENKISFSYALFFQIFVGHLVSYIFFYYILRLIGEEILIYIERNN